MTDFYDTVDSAEIAKRNPTISGSPPTLSIRGVLAGANAPITRVYVFAGQTDLEGLQSAMHCHRLAVLTLSKPGKYQFAIHAPNVGAFDAGCRLTLVTP